MRALLLAARRVPPVPSPLLLEVTDQLAAHGVRLDWSVPEEEVTDLEQLVRAYDLVLLKSHTELALSLAAVLHHAGVRVVNPYPACALTQDKIATGARLSAFGVPVPRSWVTGEPARLDPADLRCPVVLKPHRGHRGEGVTRVDDLATLRALPPFTRPHLVQEWVPGPGEDLKVYVVDRCVLAVRKPFAEGSFALPGRPAEVTERVREIALAIGGVLGLDLFGADLVEGPDGPVVVDVNYFPGYKGLLGVAELVTRYLLDVVDGRPDPHPLAGAGPPAAPARVGAG